MNCPKCDTELKEWKEEYDVHGKVPFPFELLDVKVWDCMKCHVIIVGDDE